MRERPQVSRIVTRLRILGQGASAALDESCRAADLDVSCKSGCAGCCHQLVVSSMLECLPIAAMCLTGPLQSWFAQAAPELRRQANLALEPEMSTEKWFLAKEACVFLDDANMCRVYDVRPTACRLLTVVSDPTQCHPDNGIQPVGRLDTEAASRRIFSEHYALARELGVHDMHAPLPIALVWATIALTQGVAALKKHVEGTPFANRETNLRFWERLRPANPTTLELAT